MARVVKLNVGGHQYRTTLLFYGETAPDLNQALAWLGWDAAD